MSNVPRAVLTYQPFPRSMRDMLGLGADFTQAREAADCAAERTRNVLRRATYRSAESIMREALGMPRRPIMRSIPVMHEWMGAVSLATPEEFMMIRQELAEARQVPELKARERIFGTLWD